MAMARRAAATSLLASALAVGAAAQNGLRGPAAPQDMGAGNWVPVPVAPGTPFATRPQPPKEGRTRCIGMNGIAGAQLFSDRAIELSMRDGRRFRMFFASECQALSFYQGFYYRRAKAGQICAGRDAIGARSGGECPIASIIEVKRFKPSRK